MFHRITQLDPEKDFLISENSISPEKFEEFLRFFAENQIEILTFFDVKRIEWGLKKWPKKAIVLSFDDGYDHHFEVAKTLKKYGFRGVFFVISEKIGTDGYLSKEQIREMAFMGHEIGSHSATHPNMENLSEDSLRKEIGESKRKIEEVIGMKIISFCFPSGKYDQRSFSVLEQEGYEFARTTHSGKIFYPNKKFELKITRIFPKTSLISIKNLFLNEHNFYSKNDI